MNSYALFAEMIKESENLCVFSGAGISCPSGIPDFRSADGLYNKEGEEYPPEQIISHTFFMDRTELFYRFYKENMVYANAKPNAAHLFFASLEQGRHVSVVTQNIDGLHQAAGSSEVYELHGSVHRNYCTRCGKFYPLSAVTKCKGVPLCSEDKAVIKPDVVLYEEPLNEAVVQNAIDAIYHADTLVVAGTSLVVYPAAAYLRYFRGKNLVVINKSDTNLNRSCDLCFQQDVVEVVEKVKEYLQ